MDLNFSTVIWAIINFLVILAILYKFAYNPVMKFLDNRSEEIANNIAEAERNRSESEALLKEYQEKIAQASNEAQEIIARANKVTEEERNRILAQTRDEAAALLERARQEIQRERDEALFAVRQEVSTLAVMAAEKILSRNLSTEDNKRIVDDFLNEVGEIH
ncbi:MAG: F0F1 ATP synthase subunit B [Thermacetogeniaceae bacterium]|jgi:F-type H+-transporting ATPase subunit b|nr:F0F1 ATP synthase subunit B [Syntrophomonadaceae bacterium]HAF17871.1 ATP synthase F0 subunit B [Peptococcaceae bacterium]